MAEGVELWRSTVRRLTWAAAAANFLGAAVMFTLLEFLVPLGAAQNLVLNGIVAAVYLPLGLVLGNLWARRRGANLEAWLAEGRPPTPEERALVLSQPYRFVVISGFFWALAAVLFTVMNAPSVVFHSGAAAPASLAK